MPRNRPTGPAGSTDRRRGARRRASSVQPPRPSTSTAPVPSAPAATTCIVALFAAFGALSPLWASSLSFSVTAKIPGSPSYGEAPASFFTWTVIVRAIGSLP
ncbi:hypothetical protein I3W98_16760 [Streptomyces cavourensis]|nr:hypothetical protein [Streptomyces cavourensis]